MSKRPRSLVGRQSCSRKRWIGLGVIGAIAPLLILPTSTGGRPRLSRQAEITELMRAIRAAGIEIVLLNVTHPRSAAQFKTGERRVVIYQDTWRRADRLLESLRHEGHHVAAYCRFGRLIQPLGSPIAAWARRDVARAGYQGRLQQVETEAWSASRIAGLTLELLGQYCPARPSPLSRPLSASTLAP